MSGLIGGSSGVTLGIDSSSQMTVAVCAGARTCEINTAERRHVELLMGQIQSVAAQAGVGLHDLRAIGVGVGPGPFTGLRVGIVTATIIGQLAGLPVKGVCSLDVLASQWVASGGAPNEFVVTVDARRQELYWARYQAGVRMGAAQVSAPGEVPVLPTAGPGVDVYPDLLATRRPAGAPPQISAGFLASHLDELPDAGLEPLYLRKPDAELPSTRKSTLASGRLGLPRLARRRADA